MYTKVVYHVCCVSKRSLGTEVLVPIVVVVAVSGVRAKWGRV